MNFPVVKTASLRRRWCSNLPVAWLHPLCRNLIQIAVLGPNEENQLSARRLSEDELLEHKQNVNYAMEYFKSYRDVLHGKKNDMRSPTQSIPKSPFRI